MDVTADPHSIAHLLCRSTHKDEKEHFLDVKVAEDLRANRLRSTVVELAISRHCINLFVKLGLVAGSLSIPLLMLLHKVPIDVHVLNSSPSLRLHVRLRI